MLWLLLKIMLIKSLLYRITSYTVCYTKLLRNMQNDPAKRSHRLADIKITCHFFIPEGFSPNGDGAHDYFVIDCIEQYPNAKLMIFDKQGYLLYQKKNYGNANVS